MKIFFQTFCFILLSSVVATDSYAKSYRVHGQVYLKEGQDKSTRRIPPLDVVSGVPIIMKGLFGKIISLVFVIEPPPSDKYLLTVSLLTTPKSANDFNVTILTHTFQSTLVGQQNGPFEFEKEQNGIKIGGVVAISPKR